MDDDWETSDGVIVGWEISWSENTYGHAGFVVNGDVFGSGELARGWIRVGIIHRPDEVARARAVGVDCYVEVFVWIKCGTRVTRHGLIFNCVITRGG